MSDLSRHEADRPSRLARAAAVCGTSGKFCPAERATQLLEAIIKPGDRVAIEGDNQKQADFLAATLANVDPARIHDLHMVQSVLALPDHLAVFERGIANRLDFAYAGPQSRRLAELVASKALRIGAIHTYLELYARTLVDLTPQVARRRRQGGPRRQSLYGSQHRGHAHDHRSGRVPRRHRRRAGQRDRRPAAAGRRTRRLGRCRHTEPEALPD